VFQNTQSGFHPPLQLMQRVFSTFCNSQFFPQIGDWFPERKFLMQLPQPFYDTFQPGPRSSLVFFPPPHCYLASNHCFLLRGGSSSLTLRAFERLPTCSNTSSASFFAALVPLVYFFIHRIPGSKRRYPPRRVDTNASEAGLVVCLCAVHPSDFFHNNQECIIKVSIV
jgi:hypothetical protein